ncbi:MAG: anti-virulence regulator CigR family protein [Xanthomonadales bacterium]
MITLCAAVLGLPVSQAGEVGISVVFSDNEIRVIQAYYHDHAIIQDHAKTQKYKGKKPHGLPSGIAKNLQRGKPLPPGIAKQYLPQGLHEALPTPPSGYERIIVGGKVLLVEIATGVIHDILTDVVLH